MTEIDPSTPGPDHRPGRRFRRDVVAVGAALGLTLGGLGIAAAQTDESSSSTTTTAPADGNRPPGPGPGHHGRGPGVSAAAEALGISVEELRTALRDGQSIAQVTEAKGVAVQTVIDAMVADARAHLAEKVQSGDITQAQADEKAANLQPRVTDLVNRTGGPGRGGRGHSQPHTHLSA
ncbi:MAG: hypothetical protein M3179_00290 [Actinomycetota bacterium]|nr:hypothetical protein [Actinomycetota bacterium]